MANSGYSRLFSKGPVDILLELGESRLISFSLVDRITPPCRKALRLGKIQAPVRILGPGKIPSRFAKLSGGSTVSLISSSFTPVQPVSSTTNSASSDTRSGNRRGGRGGAPAAIE